jgi:hypothetical protein
MLAAEVNVGFVDVRFAVGAIGLVAVSLAVGEIGEWLWGNAF